MQIKALQINGHFIYKFEVFLLESYKILEKILIKNML